MAHEIVFIDSDITEIDELVSGLREGVEAVVLTGGEPAVQQMSKAVAGRSGIEAVHVIAHGRPGEVSFASGALSFEIDRKAPQGPCRAWRAHWQRRHKALGLRLRAWRIRRSLHRRAVAGDRRAHLCIHQPRRRGRQGRQLEPGHRSAARPPAADGGGNGAVSGRDGDHRRFTVTDAPCHKHR